MASLPVGFLDSMPERYVVDVLSQLHALGSYGKGDKSYFVEMRGLPVPVWGKRGLLDNGLISWDVLRGELITSSVACPICIYLHVPFCVSHCAFCDCYAYALRRNLDIHTSRYTDCLISEMHLWAGQDNLPKRPVKTIHLGGGTPTILGENNLTRLCRELRDHFMIDLSTEWAMETTSSSLDDPTLKVLKDLGFTRLHIGVQSLQDDVRKTIGRRENSSAVINKVEKALSSGFIVSVDVIVGLPYQTSQGLLDDLDRLIKVGVEGFSVYELQHSSHNHTFFINQNLSDISAVQKYLLFQLAFQFLENHGYSKNVFNHLAKGRDRNLYFTFPTRGEDLLALGTISDGVFGNYHYRHAEYSEYIRQISQKNTGLLGGVRRTPQEDLMHRLEVQIMSGQIDLPTFIEILGKESADTLFQRWSAHQMIRKSVIDNRFTLTPNGAWFAGQLLQEMSAYII